MEWLKNSQPDIVLLQELKCVEEQFPFEALFDAGYNAAVSGQKTYNGVAILSKFKIEEVVKGLPESGGDPDEQARYIEALISVKGKVIRVSSIYVPNGGGDFNVAAEEIDVFDPKSLNGTVCFHPTERQKFRTILNLGLNDSYRSSNHGHQAFSWYDYRGGSWQNGKGMRIDYLLTSPLATDKIISSAIEDKGVRDQEKASDHCPCVLTIEL